MGIKIVHIACQNTAGIISTFVKCERELGFDSTLITMIPHPYGFENGLCLNYPFINESWFKGLREVFKGKNSSCKSMRKETPPIWSPSSRIEEIFFSMRDQLYDRIIRKKGILEILDSADILVLDGGLGLRRDCKYELDWVKKKGRLVSVFYGSDLRVRGVIKPLDEKSALHFTLEFDHLKLHPKAKYIFYPFEHSRVPPPHSCKPDKIRVGHSPTKWEAKGTSKIVETALKLERENKIEFLLIQNLPYKKAVELQSTCHIFIDQLSGLGYGLSGLQAIAMGIPTLVNLKKEHEEFLGDHPFVNFDETNLEEKLIELVENRELREKLGKKGIEWVKRVHDPMKATKTMVDEYRNLGWV